MTRKRIEGTLYDVEISFPWADGTLFLAQMIDKNGRVIEEFRSQIPAQAKRDYGRFIPLAQQFVNRILSMK